MCCVHVLNTEKLSAHSCRSTHICPVSKCHGQHPDAGVKVWVDGKELGGALGGVAMDGQGQGHTKLLLRQLQGRDFGGEVRVDIGEADIWGKAE